MLTRALFDVRSTTASEMISWGSFFAVFGRFCLFSVFWKLRQNVPVWTFFDVFPQFSYNFGNFQMDRLATAEFCTWRTNEPRFIHSPRLRHLGAHVAYWGICAGLDFTKNVPRRTIATNVIFCGCSFGLLILALALLCTPFNMIGSRHWVQNYTIRPLPFPIRFSSSSRAVFIHGFCLTFKRVCCPS